MMNGISSINCRQQQAPKALGFGNCGFTMPISESNSKPQKANFEQQVLEQQQELLARQAKMSLQLDRIEEKVTCESVSRQQQA